MTITKEHTISRIVKLGFVRNRARSHST